LPVNEMPNWQRQDCQQGGRDVQGRLEIVTYQLEVKEEREPRSEGGDSRQQQPFQKGEERSDTHGVAL
jgi:hypothetical protein